MIKLICAYFNFTDNPVYKQNYIKFRKNLNHPITTVEVALKHQKFFIDDSIKILANSNNLMWQKERMLNIAISTLPDNCDKICWLDTDIIFQNKNWLSDTEKLLDNYKIVQVFDTVRESPQINTSHNTISLAKCLHEKKPYNLIYPAIGLGWAFRRDILIDDKIYDKDIVGNSDAMQLMCWFGCWNHDCISSLYKPYQIEFLEWGWQSYEKVQSNFSFTPGKIHHFFHGRWQNRYYVARRGILRSAEYIPSKDIELDSNCLYKFSTDQFEMQKQISKYFTEKT